MRRGELYRVQGPPGRDPRRQRVFVVVRRQVLIDSRHATVTCAPVYSAYDGLSTQVPVGASEGLKHDSSIHCDELVSLPKAALTAYVGALRSETMRALNSALAIALELDDVEVGSTPGWE